MLSADVEHLGIRCSLQLRLRLTAKQQFIVVSWPAISERFSQCWGSGISSFISYLGKTFVFLENLLLQPWLFLPATLSRFCCHSPAQPVLVPITPTCSAAQYFSFCPINLPCDTWLVTQIFFPSPFFYAWFPVFIPSQSLQTKFWATSFSIFSLSTQSTFPLSFIVLVGFFCTFCNCTLSCKNQNCT